TSLYSDILVFPSHPTPPHLHPFPTRRSSDLAPCWAIPTSTASPRSPSRCPRRPRCCGPISRRRSRATARPARAASRRRCPHRRRSEEHTSELQSRFDLVCRLLLEKKKEMTPT